MIGLTRSHRPARLPSQPRKVAIPSAAYRDLSDLPRPTTRRITLAAAVGTLLLTPVAAQRVPPADPAAHARAIAAGYKALTLCSGLFHARRDRAALEALELRGIYPDYDAIVPELPAKIEAARYTGLITVAFDPALPPRAANWRWDTGCTIAPIGATPALERRAYRVEPPRFTARHKPDPRPWPMGDAGVAPAPSPALAAAVARAFEPAAFGRNAQTVGVAVLKDGAVIAERYRDGFGPFTANRTWSVAKSMAGTLVGMARLRGAVDPARPAPVPEWSARGDPRAAITTDQLLRMASGLGSDTAGNRTDAIYFGGTAVTEQATGWPLAAPPGARFRYANNDILLAVRGLREAMGEQPYRTFPQEALFGPLGMAHTVAERDWRGDFILSSQVWSTARDLARLGQFWLQDGVWQGRRLLPEGWLRYMTAPAGPQPADGPGYGATLWLFGPKQGLPAGSFAAQGNRGQYIMVVPSERLVVVRRGEDPAGARFDPARFTADILRAMR